MNAVWAAVVAANADRPDREVTLGVARWGMERLLDRVDEVALDLRARVPEGGALTLSAATPLGALVGVCAALAAERTFVPVAAPGPRCSAVARRTGASWHLHLNDQAGTDLIHHQGGTADADLVGVAYAITTSGSTGIPKIVLVDDDSLLQRLCGLASATGFSAGNCLVAMASLTFDISLVELLLPLLAGGRIALPEASLRIDPTSLGDTLERFEVSHLQATPSYLRLAQAVGWTPTAGLSMWVGGEVMTPRLAGNLLSHGVDLWNLYGPTETTLWATADRVPDPDNISIGTPLAGLAVDYVPAGHGLHEVVISGRHLSGGYLDPTPADAARFSTTHVGSEGATMSYRTGDLVLLGDGVSFRGRTDDQVKIRGQRIELPGLERVAEAHPLVRESAAVVTKGENEDLLVLHVVAEPSLTDPALRAWMVEHLPREHAPNVIRRTSRLPRTTSGKIDRRALSLQLESGPR